MDQRDLVRELRKASAYPHSPEPLRAPVGFLETHISLLFFAGPRVYKVKKSLDRGFLDYTTLEKREHFCREEVRLNRRLAAEVYLGVVPIVRTADDALVVAGEGEPIEWAVEMVRLPEDRMLSVLLDRGAVDNAHIHAVVDLLVGFHADSPTGDGVDEYGSAQAMALNVEENFTQIQEFVGSTSSRGMLTSEQCQHIADRQRLFLTEERELFDRRVREGRIREGHGDLHAGNLCITEGGVVAYDCIEFNRRFRCGDVASELAFLAMDLDQRGYPAFSSYLAWRYGQQAADVELARMLAFYKTYRAIVRAKVTSMAVADLSADDPRRPELRAEAMRYFQLAASYELPPALIVLCGLPGAGRSWLAKRLARALRAVVLSGDLRRRREAAAAGAAANGSGELSLEGYRALSRDAIEALGEGHSVIVDAPFSRRELRAGFVDAAERLELPYQVVHVTAPEELVRRRIEARQVSTDLDGYLRARDIFEAPTEVEEDRTLEVTSEAGTPEQESALVIDRMIAFARSR